jgi:hypothetical protein
MLRRAAFGLLPLLLLAACDRTPKAEARDTPPIPTVPEKVPPAASFNATPVAQFADAGNLEGAPPFEQAIGYEANGQLWMARLVLEQKALGSDATKNETELLLKICMQQDDAPCVESCGKKLGRKIKFDAGAPRDARSSSPVSSRPEHAEPDTELAKIRDLVLKKELDRARKALEPKVLDGKASREEVRLLSSICTSQNDRMCVALCEQKLK